MVTLSLLHLILIVLALAVVLAGIVFALNRSAIVHFFKALLTEDDADQVPCMARIGWLVGIVSLVVMTLVAVLVNHATFDPVTFGAGFGAVNAAGGAGVALKGKL